MRRPAGIVQANMQQRFFSRLESAKSVLIAGAGGGFDIFSGLPLYFHLRAAGKTVHLANLSFSDIHSAEGRFLTPALLEVRWDTQSRASYFPELHLCRWFRQRDEDVPIYCFDRAGIAPITEGYARLVEELNPEAIVLVDGGTDSLMRGDEFGLGTPQEDLASIAAVDATAVPIKLLACIGFGIDSFHGVCHAHFLESVAALVQQGGYLGAWSFCREMPEYESYRAACEFVFERMPRHRSIVTSSILSAVDGHFGDHHSTPRTDGSELFINPLMSLYWAFELRAVVARHLFLDRLRNTETYMEVSARIAQCRSEHAPVRPWQSLPM